MKHSHLNVANLHTYPAFLSLISATSRLKKLLSLNCHYFFFGLLLDRLQTILAWTILARVVFFDCITLLIVKSELFLTDEIFWMALLLSSRPKQLDKLIQSIGQELEIYIRQLNANLF